MRVSQFRHIRIYEIVSDFCRIIGIFASSPKVCHLNLARLPIPPYPRVENGKKYIQVTVEFCKFVEGLSTDDNCLRNLFLLLQIINQRFEGVGEFYFYCDSSALVDEDFVYQLYQYRAGQFGDVAVVHEMLGEGVGG